MSAQVSSSKVPVLLLKTRSIPVDEYDELFSTPQHVAAFEPCFVPVLEHLPDEDGLTELRALLDEKEISQEEDASYGGLIFTSQRAAEAFVAMLVAGRGYPRLSDVPIYSVGPATSRILRSVDSPSLQIFGEHTGNGEALSRFILQHYHTHYSGRTVSQKLLFVVGEQRRDIIPKTLDDPALPPEQRIDVAELVVYNTITRPSFASDLADALAETAGGPADRWVVAFSPAGADALLEGLGLEGGLMNGSKNGLTNGFKNGLKNGLTNGRRQRSADAGEQGRTRIAAIGPTTRDYLMEKLGIEPDACAAKPSPEGLMEAIVGFMQQAVETTEEGK